MLWSCTLPTRFLTGLISQIARFKQLLTNSNTRSLRRNIRAKIIWKWSISPASLKKWKILWWLLLSQRLVALWLTTLLSIVTWSIRTTMMMFIRIIQPKRNKNWWCPIWMGFKPSMFQEVITQPQTLSVQLKGLDLTDSLKHQSTRTSGLQLVQDNPRISGLLWAISRWQSRELKLRLREELPVHNRPCKTRMGMMFQISSRKDKQELSSKAEL